MASWFERGRPALFDALAAVCQQIDHDIAADLHRAVPADSLETAHADLQARFDQQMASIEALERDNAELRLQVATLTRQSHNNAAPQAAEVSKPSGRDAIAPQSTSSSAAVQSKDANVAQGTAEQMPDFVKLAKRFKALSENFRKAREALERRKYERDAWKVRFQSLQSSMRTAEQKHGIIIQDTTSVVQEHIPAEVPLGSSFNMPDDPVVSSENPEEPDLPPAAPAYTSSGASSAKVLGPLDSTQGESEGIDDNELPSLPTTDAQSDVAIKNEPSSDTPFVVSERAVKKRKLDNDNEAAPVKIKPEPEDDSSPVATNTRRMESQESLDLGEISHRMMTPRKRRELELEQQGKLATLGHMATPIAGYVRPDNFPQTARPSHATSALTPLSVNMRQIRSGGDKPFRRALNKQRDSGIASLAEDGEHYRNHENKTPIRSGTMICPPTKNRLDELLNSPAASEQAVWTPTARSNRMGKATPTEGLHIPVRRELPFGKSGRPVAKQQPAPGSTTMAMASNACRAASPPKKRQQSTLRRKPISELRLEDFKINPSANEGHDFAFADVVRDKADRSCLPGCTDMHCCGKEFRALALSQRPNPPLTAAQRQEEQKLLESYLGDYAYRLATMDKEERSELWVEAKTQELANKYGKHRHRYSRMRSPPGFWNADFPSTQELEENRQEAAERQRKSIQERHREAMRPGGRWIFRDE